MYCCIFAEGNISAARSLAAYFGCRDRGLAPAADAAYALLAKECGSSVTLPFRSVPAVAEMPGVDLRDSLHERADVRSAFSLLSVADGVVFHIERSRLRASLKAMRMLRASILAAGRDPDSVPIAYLLTPACAREHVEDDIQGIRDLFEIPRETILPLDRMSGERAVEVVELLLGLLQRNKAQPDPRVERGSDRNAAPEWSRFEPDRELTSFEWTGGRPSSGQLLDAWRVCRSSDLADLLDADLYASRSLRPEAVNHLWWIETCRRRDARDLPVLIDTLFLWEREESASTSHWRWDPVPLGEHANQVMERLSGLAWWEDDPRMTVRVASSLQDFTRYRRASVWGSLFRLLGRHGDPRSIGVAARVAGALPKIRPPLTCRDSAIAVDATSLWDGLVHRFGKALPGSLAIDPKHQEAWQSLVDRTRRPLPRPEDMEAVAADPKNDDVRREVAERMRERGDPRGEFILLQLQKATGSLSPEEHEREQALKRTYAWDWLGPLADVVDVENSVFEKGYPVKLTVWTPNTRALAEVVGKPEWATVREIRWGGDPCWEEEKPDADLVEHPVMRSLEKVTTKMPEDPAELEALRRVAWAR